MNTIFFIGAGKMATAIASGLARSQELAGTIRITAYDPLPEAGKHFAERCGGTLCSSAEEGLKGADTVILAVKPQYFAEALKPAAGKMEGKLILTIAAGIPLETVYALTGSRRVIRIMPNTPALAGEGMSCLAPGEGVSAEDRALALSFFRSVGKAVEVPEKNMDAVTGLSGSAPAYVLEFINALADGGVYAGLPRQQALLLAAQTVFGTAKLYLEENRHPSQLRDDVISPGGTTARGVMTLAEGAFSATVAKAVIRAAERSAELGKNVKK